MQLSLVANIFVILPERASSLYLVFLLCALGQVAMFFLVLLDSVFPTSDH